MAYSTAAEIKHQLSEEIIIQLTDDEHVEPETIDDANPDHAAMVTRIDEAIETADAEIDGYCATRYAVPFVTVPALINKLSVEIAIYYLYARRTIPEKIEARYDKVIARLKDIARGTFTLGTDPAPTGSTAAGGAESNKTTDDRVFTRESLKGF